MNQVLSTQDGPSTPVPALSLGRLPAIIIAVGLLVVLASCAIVAATIRQAALEQQDLKRRLQVECLVLRTRVNSAWVRTTPANAPGGGAPPGPVDGEVRYRPQALVRYELDGSEIEEWIDVGPETDQFGMFDNEAAIRKYKSGQNITGWFDPDGSATLELRSGDGGRMTRITGLATAFFVLMPGIGLILTGWLLRRMSILQQPKV
jgi:hypothetical protein